MDKVPAHLIGHLDAEIALYTSGATTEEELDSAIVAVLAEYREWSRGERSDAGISAGER
ncbi:hypothetical protein ACIBL3_17415 [Kribbella sp. NPDC050124]|uniref:hypothetical protein n=1 Tax=Kribbella sp. NPDC050124 TaxID=3364114 RepID=UPI0037BBD8C5